MPADGSIVQAGDQEGSGRQTSGAGRLATAISVGAALVAALIFWAVTTFTGSYTAVARYGGAAWVFLLMMIVLMPIVIPRVSRLRQRRTDDVNER